MAAPFDVVVTIGGQSFVDGLWRILGPALERLTNPLPLAIPGFANARMRVTNLVPVFPTVATTNGLEIVATVELTAEALLHVISAADGVTIALGPQALNLTGLTGSVAIPAQAGTLTNLLLAGGAINLGPGTGNVQLPPVTGTLTGAATGTIGLPAALALPSIPLPAIVPVAVDLTPTLPLVLPARVPIAVGPPSPLTRFSLLFMAGNVAVSPIPPVSPALAATLQPRLQAAVDSLVAQLGIPVGVTQPPVDLAAVTALIAPVPAAVAAALDEALTLLLAETGRLIFPAPGAGASCAVKALPTEADAVITSTPGNGFELQVGLTRVGGVGDIPAFPASSGGAIECQVLVGNSFLLDLLCCLVEQLPAFALPVAATPGTTDVAGTTHLRCCNFTGVTATFGPIAVGGGGLSVCIDGPATGPKSFSLVGRFRQNVPNVIPLISTFITNIASVSIDFTLPLAFDFDDAASIANLRLGGAAPTITVAVTPTISLIVLLLIVVAISAIIGVATGLIAGIVAAVMSPLVVVIVMLLIYLACGAVTWLLNNAVRLVLAGALLVKSPVAVPPGLFEAFGRLSPVSVTVDDLEANGVLHTPTSPWGLLPRLGLAKRRRPKPGGTTHGDPAPSPAVPTPPPPVAPIRPKPPAGGLGT